MTPAAIRLLQQFAGLLLIVVAGAGAIVWCLDRLREAIEETRWPDVRGALERAERRRERGSAQ